MFGDSTTIKAKIIAGNIFVLMIAFVIIYFINSTHNYEALKKQMLENNSMLVTKINENINFLILDIRRLSTNIILDTNIQKILIDGKDANPTENFIKVQDLGRELRKYKVLRDSIIAMTLIDEKGCVACDSPEMNE
jgi:two-component system sensor histidine kinase YesM